MHFDVYESSVREGSAGAIESKGSNNKGESSSVARSMAGRKPVGEFRVTQGVLSQIQQSIGTKAAEQGGMLGGDRKDGVVRHFYFDKSASRTGATYSPDHLTLNELLSKDWNPTGINLLGFVHSHPGRLDHPSGGDCTYARTILDAIPEMDHLFMPIVLSEPDTGRFQFFPFAAYRQGDGVRIEPLELIVEGAPGQAIEMPEPPEPAYRKNQRRQKRSLARIELPAVRKERVSIGNTFLRVRGAYDLLRLEVCRVISVGAGGGAGFLEDLGRAGVGEFVFIDPDKVSVTNLATQQTYRRDIGRPKVDCIAERLRDINPNALIATCPVALDEIDDATFAQLAKEPWRSVDLRPFQHGGRPVWEDREPVETLLCGLTDNFEAQARVNRLALQFALPSLCAQVYAEGRGAEVTFTHADTTPACQRCALSSRYKAYLEEGFQNNVTSDGTPIFSTTRLNALKGYIAMAILHHGTNHPRWGGLLRLIGNRNLLQIRMDPSLDLPAFRRAFREADRERVFCDDVVWLPQKPDCPENGFPSCPDCGGKGDLLTAKGTFSDTRIMRKG